MGQVYYYPGVIQMQHNCELDASSTETAFGVQARATYQPTLSIIMVFHFLKGN